MKLDDYIKKIKSSPKYNSKHFIGDFPNPSTLQEKPQKHLNIIVEQAEYIIDAFSDYSVYKDNIGLLPTSIDIEFLANIFIDDIQQFAAENPNLELFEISFFLAQKRLSSYTLFSLSRSNILPDTYRNHIELRDQKSVFALYSVPFLVRLSIEKKLKAMIGFKLSETKLSDGRTNVSDQFPVLKVLNFLIKNDLIESPLSFTEIKKLYNWSCKFVHTGKKEYIWMSLKAVSHLNKLFSKDNSPYYGEPICYLKSGVTLKELQSSINTSLSSNKSNEDKITEESIQLELSNYEFDLTTGFWDNRKN